MGASSGSRWMPAVAKSWAARHILLVRPMSIAGKTKVRRATPIAAMTVKRAITIGAMAGIKVGAMTMVIILVMVVAKIATTAEATMIEATGASKIAGVVPTGETCGFCWLKMMPIYSAI